LRKTEPAVSPLAAAAPAAGVAPPVPAGAGAQAVAVAFERELDHFDSFDDIAPPPAPL